MIDFIQRLYETFYDESSNLLRADSEEEETTSLNLFIVSLSCRAG